MKIATYQKNHKNHNRGITKTSFMLSESFKLTFSSFARFPGKVMQQR